MLKNIDNAIKLSVNARWNV